MGSALHYPSFRNLFFANLLSQIGSKIHRVALLFIAYSVTQNAVGVSLVLAVQVFSSAILGPLLSPLIDRYDRRSIMLGSDLFRAFLVLLIPLFALKSLPLLAVLSLLIAVFSEAIYAPAKNAVIPELVPEKELDHANALMLTAERLGDIGFVALAGVLVATVGPVPAFWIDAVSYLLSALLLIPLPKLPGQPEEGGFFQAVRAGIEPLWLDPTLRRTIGTFAVAAMVGSVEGALGIVLAIGALKIGTQGFGLLESVQALGLIVGLGLVGYVLRQYSREQTFLGGLLGFGLLTVSIGLFPFTPWVVVVLFLLGLMNAGFIIPARSIVQLAAPPALRGRIFAAYGAVMDTSMLVGMILAGVLEPRIGVLNVFIFSGLAMSIIVIWVMLSGGIPQPDDPNGVVIDLKGL